ncbi:hypothetical protein Sango_0628200 [Sesamum angolense]|uniref:Uncharacterized protein n=1 Tax=Sesamum angolense TaxID=2727404 RepID=A0AAE2C235_9LAMI|nr:hypothetical protein Sango_0628200 [Sesamum angolense]
MFAKYGPFKFVDDGHAEELDHSYFVAIRSSYLTLRQGGRFIIEPYSPHRFGRQFGYYQDVPGTLKYDTRVASLEEGLYYWCLCVLSKSSSKDHTQTLKDEDKQVDDSENNPPHALIPPVVIECDSQAAIAEASKRKSPVYRRWKESETNHLSTMAPPLGMGLRRKQSPPPAAVSIFKCESFLSNYQKEFLQRLWSGLLVKISNTSVDFLSSIEDDVYLILESMKSFQKFDVSKMEELLNTFFAKVRAYYEARSLSSEKLSRSLHEQQLKEAKARLQDVQTKASEEASEIQTAMNELNHIDKDIVVLKGRRTSLRSTLKGKKQLNHDTQAKVHAIEKDIAAFKSTGPLDDAVVENLESSRASLGILKEGLKSLNPFA